MKKIIIATVLALASLSASAGVLNKNFTSTDNKVFSIDQARSITFNSGYITLGFVDGGVSGAYLADANGATSAKVKSSSAFTQYVRVGTSERFINPAFAKYIVCTNGVTTVGWNVGGSEDFQDACQLHNAVKALAN